MKFAPTLLLMIPFITLSFSVTAQTESRSATIYRCGPDGRDLRESPCPAGMQQAKATEVRFDQPSAAQTQAAQNQKADAAQQADQMEQQRLRREAHEKRHAGGAAEINGLSGSPKIKSADGPKVTQLKPPKTTRSHKPKTNASAG